MKCIKFIDENFLGQKGFSRYSDPKVNWDRECTDYDTVIYTDRLCFSQPIDNTKTNYAWIVEPPIINGENYVNIAKNSHNFKNVFSYIRNLGNQIDNFVFVPHGSSWIKDEDMKIHDKTKMVSSIFSWKDWNAYHRMRHRVYERFKETNKVDFYGSGCGKELDYKFDAIKDYMFSIVIENSIEYGLFTEKLLDCFLSGTIPIYVGNKNNRDFFDENGIIFFEGDEDLPNILDNLNEELYNSKIESVKKNFELAKNYMFPEQLIQKFLEENES